MKKFKLLLSSFLLLVTTIPFQLIAQSAKDIFNPATPITYLGVDFSQAKLIGDGAAYAPDLKNKVYPGINQVVINEPKKYDLNKALSRTNVTNEIGIAETQNGKVNTDSIKTQEKTDLNRFTPATIDKIINDYNFSGKKGIGLVFIVEAMSKPEEKAAVWPTFVNMDTHKVLLTERMLGKAGGFGYRNYWVKPISEIIEDIQKDKYKEWSIKYQ